MRILNHSILNKIDNHDFIFSKKVKKYLWWHTYNTFQIYTYNQTQLFKRIPEKTPCSISGEDTVDLSKILLFIVYFLVGIFENFALPGLHTPLWKGVVRMIIGSYCPIEAEVPKQPLYTCERKPARVSYYTWHQSYVDI